MTDQLFFPKKPLLVFAGNYHQYLNFLWEYKLRPRDAVFINSCQQLRGMCNERLILYGNFYDNPGCREILEAAKFNGFKIIDEAELKEKFPVKK